MVIRELTDSDWPSIHPFFSDIVAAGETYAYPDGLGPEETAQWWRPTAPREAAVVLTESGPQGRILGTAKMGPNRPGRGDHVGTASFMVASDARGRGVGRQLGEYVIDWHRRHDFAGIQFNAVVETNTGAVRLWRSLGFEIVGTVPRAFRSRTHGLVGLHVMYLSLED